MSGEREESILAFDSGSVLTKAFLIDKVEGQFRFVAKGEALTTHDNLGEGLAAAVREIESKTGRKLLHEQSLLMPEDADGNGTDAAVAACSAARPIRLIGAGISPAQSSSEVAAVAAGAMAEVVGSICIQDVRANDQAEQKAADLQAAQPDAILFLADPGSGANPLLDELGDFIAKAGITERSGDKLPVIMAASPESYAVVDRLLGAVVDLRATDPVRANAGPVGRQSAIAALNDLYYSHSVQKLPGLRPFANEQWSAVIAAPNASRNIARFLARQSGTDVLLLDLGANTISAALVAAGRSDLEVSANCGMGPGLNHLLAVPDITEAEKWLPFEARAEQLLQVGLTKALFPHTVAQLPEEMLIEESFARMAVKYATRRISFKSGLLVASGGFFSQLPRSGRLMLLLLDAIQPTGLVSVAFDPLNIIPALGVLAEAYPQAAGEALMKDALLPLGSAISLTGSGKEGQLAARITIRQAEGGEFQAEVPWGGLEVIPLLEGQKATLVIQPAADVRVGDSPKGRRVELQVSGGAVGVVVDARGRPLRLPDDARQRMEKLSQWYRALDL